MTTLRYMLRRLLWMVPTLWVIATLTFFFIRFIPGGPFDQERQLPPEIKANVAARYGLDQPTSVQYWRYMNGLLRGDSGPSLKYLGRSTGEIIAETFPVSAHLGLLALALAMLIGLPLGFMSGANPRSPLDRFVLLFTSFGISLPNFVFAVLLVAIFSFWLKWLPPALWEGPPYQIMPAIVLSLYPMATVARLARVSMMETLHLEFIQTARAKGLKERQVRYKHALRNSLSAVVTVFGPITAALITGSFIVESIFAIPGMGQFFVTAVTNRDYPLVLGVTLVDALIVMLANLLVDCLYPLIDPRVRLN